MLVLFLPEQVHGIAPAGKFLLTTLPTALGSFVRLPHTLALATTGVNRPRLILVRGQPVESLRLFVVGFVGLLARSGIGNGRPA